MIVSIQYLRAIAALFVVLHHSLWKAVQFEYPVEDFFSIGNSGVDLFFIISGYIIILSLRNKEVNITKFIKNRIIRIIPLYWLLSIIALVIYLIEPSKVNSSGGETDIFRSFFLLPSENNYLINNGWTLSFEFYFYIIVAFAMLFRKVNLIPLLTILMLTILSVIGGFTEINNYVYAFLTSELLIEFVFGVLIYIFFNSETGLKTNMLACAICLIFSISYLFVINIELLFESRVINYGVPYAILFASFLGFESYLKQSQGYFGRFLEYIGESSYSLYLIHPFVLVPMSIIVNLLPFSIGGTMFVIILLIASLFGGFLTYEWLEKPLIKFFKKKRVVHVQGVS